MESLKRSDSILSISSIISDSHLKDDDSEIAVKQNAMLKILLEAATDTSAENLALSNEILELLSTLKFDMRHLSPDIRDGFQTIGSILKSEGLGSIDEIVMELCLEKKNMLNKMKEREDRLLKAKYNYAFAKYNTLEDKLNQLRKEIEQGEDNLQEKLSNSENEESNRMLWSNRLHDYKKTIKKLEDEIDNLQIEEIGLEQIQSKSITIEEKMSKLAELNKVLSKYNELPPNLLQAKNALDNKKREQKEIENLLHKECNL